jgi:hypothetical protein
MKKFMLLVILCVTAVVFCQQPVVLSDEYHLWNGSGWNKMDYEYNTVDSTGTIAVKTTPDGTYSRYDYEGYYQLEYYNSGSSGNSAWTINSYYKYDGNEYLIKYSYTRENYWMGIFDGAWGNETFLTYSDGSLSSNKEIEFEFGKPITTNTLREYTYNPDKTINSESYSDSTSAGWVQRSRILWSYNKGTSTGIKESYIGAEWVNSEKYDRVLNDDLDPVSENRSVWNGSAWEPSELDELYYNSANSHIKTVTYTYNTETGEYDLYSKRDLLWNDGVEMNSISGYAFLEGLDNHSGIEVFFQRVVPDSAFTLTAFTNSSGYFSGLLEDGYYDISYSISGFSNVILEDISIYSDQTMSDQTLTIMGQELSGSIKAILESGEYIVTDTLTVLEGDSLIIEPGVTLKFGTDVPFQINGYLKAEGTKSDKIYFRAYETSWGGMRISNTEAVISELIYEGSNWTSLSQTTASISNSVLTYINSWSSTLSVDNCQLEHLFIDNSEVFANNSTLHGDNLCIDFSGGSLNIYNCVILSVMYGIFSNGSGNLSVEYSNVYSTGTDHFMGCGPYLGVPVTTNANGDPCDAYGNISLDPKFVDAANGDFRLQADSPCIDTGTNTISDYEFPLADLDGNYRIWDGNGDSNAIVDMGAYEYGAPAGIENNEADISDFRLYQNYPNPFNPVTTISYALPDAAQVELNVYNLQGQLVQSLVNGRSDKGMHKAEFNGADLTSGMYIYNLKVDGKSVQSKKMMLLK